MSETLKWSEFADSVLKTVKVVLVCLAVRVTRNFPLPSRWKESQRKQFKLEEVRE